MINGDGTTVLCDFGMSTHIYSSDYKLYTFVGSPCWMAPEVIEQKHGYDLKADIWSVGMTALELADGKVPFYDLPAMAVLINVINRPSP